MLFETRLNRVGFAVVINLVFVIAAVAVGLVLHAMGLSINWSYTDGLTLLIVGCLVVDLLIWRKMPREL